jgi:hypothetical protein
MSTERQRRGEARGGHATAEALPATAIMIGLPPPASAPGEAWLDQALAATFPASGSLATHDFR